ncbi:MAG: hypothetical protein K2O46_06210, partial [Bacteroidales bacterium]|nr:hypothetical protein [Bacteroidales bacterium]
ERKYLASRLPVGTPTAALQGRPLFLAHQNKKHLSKSEILHKIRFSKSEILYEIRFSKSVLYRAKYRKGRCVKPSLPIKWAPFPR